MCYKYDLTIYVRTVVFFFFFNDTATTEIYTLSLHDALPISARCRRGSSAARSRSSRRAIPRTATSRPTRRWFLPSGRSEEHTSELQSRQYIGCRLLLEKKKQYR